MWLVLEILLFLLSWLSEYLPHPWLCLYPALLSHGRGTDVCCTFKTTLKWPSIIFSIICSYHVQALLVGSVCIISFELILLQLFSPAYVY